VIKTDHIRTNTADIVFAHRTEFSERIWIRIVDDVSNSDIHHIWILEILYNFEIRLLIQYG
jgi:hypothetical protein